MITFQQAKKAFTGGCGYCGRPGRPGSCYQGPLPGKIGSLFRLRCPGCGYPHEGIEGTFTNWKRVATP